MEETENRLRETIYGILFYFYWFHAKRFKTRMGAQYGAFVAFLAILSCYSSSVGTWSMILFGQFSFVIHQIIFVLPIILFFVMFASHFLWKDRYRNIVYNIKKYRTRNNLRNYYLYVISGFVLFCVSMAAGCYHNQRKYGKHEESHRVHIDTHDTAIQQRK